MIHDALIVCVAGLVGLALGPFLARLAITIPKWLEAEWQKQAHEILALEANGIQSTGHTPGKWHTKVIAGISCALAGLVAVKFGVSWQAAAVLVLISSLLVACAIDHYHKILPDMIIQPLIWLGFIVNSFALFATLQDSLYGAAGGYMAFWLVGRGFELIKGHPGLGDGDFKLIAVFGAWLGWQALPVIILIACAIGLVVGCIYLRKSNGEGDKTFPFGPSITLAGIFILFSDAPGQWLGLPF